MMNYQLTPAAHKRKQRQVAFGGLGLLLLILVSVLLRSPIGNLFAYFGTEAGSAFRKEVIANSDGDFKNLTIEELQFRHQILLDEMAKRREAVSVFEMSASSTEILPKEAVFRIVARPPQTPYSSMVIAAVDETLLGKTAFGSDIALGDVQEVSGGRAVIGLYSAPKEEIEVEIATTTTIFNALGKGGGVFEIIVPRDVYVAPGAPVYFAGTSYIVAYVGAVEPDPGKAFQKVYARIPFSFHEITEVTIPEYD